MFPKIHKFKRVGKAGEHEIASVLCDFVNIAIPEYDVGFDLFCQLLKNNQPTDNYFWAQIKTTLKFKEKWSQYIDKTTMRLWLNQFYPVFIFLYEKSTDIVYWTSVEEKRNEWMLKLNDANKTIKVLINRSKILKKNDENIQFKEAIKHNIILANAVQGVPHMIGEGYVRSIPTLRLSGIARSNICHTIRLGLNYLMADSWLKTNLDNAYKMANLLTSFDKGHYDHFVFLARICNQLGKDEEAIKNYDLAIDICKRDPNWNKLKKPEDSTIEEIIENLQKEKKK